VKAQMEKTSPSPLPDRDAPLRLATAAKLAFPMGGVTASGLRREAQRGNLVIERIAGKDFTTIRAIEEMRERCRLRPKAQQLHLAPIKRPRQDGSSVELALAMARGSATKLMRSKKGRRGT
jgi:hypothetical protein